MSWTVNRKWRYRNFVFGKTFYLLGQARDLLILSVTSWIHMMHCRSQAVSIALVTLLELGNQPVQSFGLNMVLAGQ